MEAPGPCRPASTRGERVTLSVSSDLYQRINGLRQSLEARFGVSLGDEGLLEYLCEKALERMEEWERRIRAHPASSPATER